MTLPYSRATAGGNALQEIQKILAGFGCQSFGTMTDNERGCMIVAFKWRDRQVSMEASYRGYAVALLKERKQLTADGQPRSQKAMGDAVGTARVAVCSLLRDWIKGQVTAIECGVLTFEDAFMPHMLLKDGRRVIDAARTANLLIE